MKELVVGYAGCAAAQVPEDGYPVTVLAVSYNNVPECGAEPSLYLDKAALEEFAKKADETGTRPWRVSWK